MMNMRRIGIGLVCLLFGGLGLAYPGLLPLASAQTPDAAAPPAVSEWEPLRTTVRTFFETVSDPSGGPQKGLEELLKTSPLSTEEKAKAIPALVNNIREINRRFGEYIAFEELGVKTIGRDLVVLRYLYKCQNYPVVWYFTFYRPQPAGGAPSRTWSLIHFYYDSNLNIPSWESN